MKKELFLNGLPDLLILRLLARREMYGYEIVAEIRNQSREVLSFGEGCIYPILHRMVKDRDVREREEAVGGRTRRYYQLTPPGKKQLAAMEQRWEKVTSAVNQIGVPAYA